MESIFEGVRSLASGVLLYALNGIWQGILIAAIGATILKYSKSLNAATRYYAWWAILAAVIVIPVMTMVMPSVSIDKLINPATAMVQMIPAEQGGDGITVIGKRERMTVVGAVGEIPVVPIVSDRTQDDQVALGATKGELASTISWLAVLIAIMPISTVAILVLVSCFLLVRIICGLARQRQIKRSSRLFGIGSSHRFDLLAKRLMVRRRVRLGDSSEVSMPVATGYRHPLVLIPSGMNEQLSEAELDTILIHELAHLRRRDDWGKLLQRIIEAIFAFNPVVPWLGRRLEFEREVACDDLVIAQTGNPREYAQCLTRLAQMTVATKGPVLAPGVLTARHQILRRFEMLLNRSEESGSNIVYKFRLYAVVAAVAVVTGLFSLVSPLVAMPPTDVSFSQMSELISKTFDANNEATSLPSQVLITGNDESVPSEVVPSESIPVLDESDRSAHSSQATFGDYRVDDEADYDPEIDDEDAGLRELSGVTEIIDGNISFAGVDDDVTTINYDDGRRTQITWHDDEGSFEIRFRGELEISDDDRSVVAISPGGYFRLRHGDGSNRREVRIKSNSDGELTFTYRIGRKKAEFDDDAREWLADILLVAVRQSGIVAEPRARRILAKDGVDGLSKEIRFIESDYVKQLYYEVLLNEGDLSAEQFSKIITDVANEFDSDYSKAELLVGVAEKSGRDRVLLPAYIDAVRSLDSDYEIRRVLSAFPLDDETDPEIALAILKIAQRLDSDYEKAELLIDMAPHSRKDDKARQAYLRAVRELDSDYETRRVLSELGTGRYDDDEYIIDLIKIASEMDSDYEKAELLIELSGHRGLTAEQLSRYADAAATLDSDYETRRVLNVLAEHDSDDPAVMGKVLKTLLRMDSDYERAELLIDFSDRFCDTGETQSGYFDIVDQLDSDYEKARVLHAFENTCDLETQTILRMLQTVSRIDSDYEKGQALAGLVSHCRGDDELEDAVLDIIDSMESDYESGNLYRKMYQRDRKAYRRDRRNSSSRSYNLVPAVPGTSSPPAIPAPPATPAPSSPPLPPVSE